MRKLLSILFLVSMALFLLACGRKGDPLPPIIEVPETTTDLTARQEGMDAVLVWSYPQLTRAGRQLVDLARVDVWVLEVPPGQDQVAAGPSGDELRRQLMLSRGTLITRLEGKTLQEATRGDKLTVRGALPESTPGKSSSSYWFVVRSRRRDGTPSALSNIVSLQPKAVPPMVTDLNAYPFDQGIKLAWKGTDGASYLIERQNLVTVAWDLITPEAISTAEYLDANAQQGQTWRYRVRAVMQRAWGPPSKDVEVSYADVFPPSEITSLTCLPEPGLVRLRWDTVSETGVTYRVLRRVGEDPWKLLSDGFTTAQFIDAQPANGVIQYSVRAVDKAGNIAKDALCRVRFGS